MVILGQCQSCGRTVPALVSCPACGSRVCHQCINVQGGFCRICGGIKKV
ncbi:MAG: orotate phosphoribosyltransferase [Candidatus Aenigmarchaeota archaeon]|nr:orotate phosphoribosyltransferase [Candidatus Aenigmarchaeota archaeon]